MDKFLRGEENHFKEHPRYLEFPFEYKDKSYPTVEDAKKLFEGQ